MAELKRRLPRAAQKLRVVPAGSDHILDVPSDEQVIRAQHIEPGKYILAFGDAAPNKNARLIADALRLIEDSDTAVVLVGDAAANIFSRNIFGLDEPRIIRLGRVTDGELRALYENALCFAFPSLYEGFGIPPLEAMRCRCPVVVSDIPALKETCGDAALYCDPTDPRSLVTHVETLTSNSSMRLEMQARGLARARAFTWDRSARLFMDIIDDVISAQGGSRPLRKAVSAAPGGPAAED